jgi:hypothetical protein
MWTVVFTKKDSDGYEHLVMQQSELTSCVPSCIYMVECIKKKQTMKGIPRSQLGRDLRAGQRWLTTPTATRRPLSPGSITSNPQGRSELVAEESSFSEVRGDHLGEEGWAQ